LTPQAKWAQDALKPVFYGSEGGVLLGIFADIHANRPAFQACLDAAQALRQGLRPKRPAR
jgi:hypothetical protein